MRDVTLVKVTYPTRFHPSCLGWMGGLESARHNRAIISQSTRTTPRLPTFGVTETHQAALSIRIPSFLMTLRTIEQ